MELALKILCENTRTQSEIKSGNVESNYFFRQNKCQMFLAITP